MTRRGRAGAAPTIDARPTGHRPVPPHAAPGGRRSSHRAESWSPAGRPLVSAVRAADRSRRPRMSAPELTCHDDLQRPDTATARRRRDLRRSKGRMPWSSNGTFLVEVVPDGRLDPGVYKPSRGERPLWDFPDGPGQARGRCLPAVARRSGWGVVPDTVLARRSARSAPGSLQRFVDADFEQHYFTLYEDESERYHDELRRCACSTSWPTAPIARAATACSCRPTAAHLRHRQRAELPRRVQAAHGHLGVRRRAHPRSPCSTTSAGSSTTASPDHLADLLDPFERDALLAAGPGRGPRAALPDRRQRSPLSLAACLTPAIPSSTSCCATSTACPAALAMVSVRCRHPCPASHDAGRQHWPAAEYAEYRWRSRRRASSPHSVSARGRAEKFACMT